MCANPVLTRAVGLPGSLTPQHNLAQQRGKSLALEQSTLQLFSISREINVVTLTCNSLRAHLSKLQT